MALSFLTPPKRRVVVVELSGGRSADTFQFAAGVPAFDLRDARHQLGRDQPA
jgi:hypothetical protein